MAPRSLIGLSALLVSTSKQMPLAVQELHERGLRYPVLVGGAAINRDFGRRILYPKGQESDETYDPGVFYCKDAFAGLQQMDELVKFKEAGGWSLFTAPGFAQVSLFLAQFTRTVAHLTT
jgi:cobalamin-dependent methionine synthase I